MALNDFKNIKKGTSSTEKSVERLIVFFEKYLPDFSTSYTLNGKMSEEDLSEELYEYLTCKAMNFSVPFAFKPEKKQKVKKGHARRVDFGIFYVQDNQMTLFYTLEAKKLPTGKGDRVKEYVVGNYGGIARFKNEQHGLDKSGNLIAQNGIIAYVHENTFEHWHTQINNWIVEAGWGEQEQLEQKYFKTIGKLQSNHTRISGNNLFLDHFWVKI